MLKLEHTNLRLVLDKIQKCTQTRIGKCVGTTHLCQLSFRKRGEITKCVSASGQDVNLMSILMTNTCFC